MRKQIIRALECRKDIAWAIAGVLLQIFILGYCQILGVNVAVTIFLAISVFYMSMSKVALFGTITLIANLMYFMTSLGNTLYILEAFFAGTLLCMMFSAVYIEDDSVGIKLHSGSSKIFATGLHWKYLFDHIFKYRLKYKINGNVLVKKENSENILLKYRGRIILNQKESGKTFSFNKQLSAVELQAYYEECMQTVQKLLETCIIEKSKYASFKKMKNIDKRHLIVNDIKNKFAELKPSYVSAIDLSINEVKIFDDICI